MTADDHAENFFCNLVHFHWLAGVFVAHGEKDREQVVVGGIGEALLDHPGDEGIVFAKDVFEPQVEWGGNGSVVEDAEGRKGTVGVDGVRPVDDVVGRFLEAITEEGFPGDL